MIFDLQIEEHLTRYGSYGAVTNGISMLPLFKTHRDMIVVEPLNREIKKYDVVLYRGSGGEYILHRVIKVREDSYVIRGDNTFFKEYVPKDRVIAILVSFNRKGKHHTTEELGYKLYSRVWVLIYPLRFLFSKIRAYAAAFFRKLKKRSK